MTSGLPGRGRRAAPGPSAVTPGTAVRAPGASGTGPGSASMIRRAAATESAAAASSARSGPLLLPRWLAMTSGAASRLPMPAILARRHDHTTLVLGSSSVYRARMLERLGALHPGVPGRGRAGLRRPARRARARGARAAPRAREGRLPRAGRRVAAAALRRSGRRPRGGGGAAAAAPQAGDGGRLRGAAHGPLRPHPRPRERGRAAGRGHGRGAHARRPPGAHDAPLRGGGGAGLRRAPRSPRLRRRLSDRGRGRAPVRTHPLRRPHGHHRAAAPGDGAAPPGGRGARAPSRCLSARAAPRPRSRGR